MSQQSEVTGQVYERTKAGPVSLAQIALETRERWGPEHGASSINGFIREVATCLLHYPDLQVGDLQAGAFVPWATTSEEADEKIDRELLSLETFLEDGRRFVFRRNATNGTL